MAGRLLARIRSTAERKRVEGEHGGIQERPAGDGTAGRRQDSRFIRKNTVGRRTDHPARGLAGGRPQRVSPGSTGDAAQEHRDLVARKKNRWRRIVLRLRLWLIGSARA